MKLMELLTQYYDNMCKREDGESDADFVTRCGNIPYDNRKIPKQDPSDVMQTKIVYPSVDKTPIIKKK
jgi:hypothetical protein